MGASAKPRLPKKVRVLGRDYAVRYNPNLEHFGTCQVVEAVIELNFEKCGSKEQLIRTLWHEIGHAFAWESGFSQIFAHEHVEELFCEGLSGIIMELNGGIIKQRR